MKRLTANRARRRRSQMGRTLTPEERVEAAVSMTNVVTALCIESIKEKQPHLSEKELISLARARFMFGRERRGQG